MAEALERKSTLGIKVETDYGTDPTLAAADVIEFTKDTSTPLYKPDMKERTVIRNTFSALDPIVGAELSAEGTIGIELHGSGTGGTAPESDPLWECAIGAKAVKTGNTTVASAASSTSFTLTSATNFAVGDAITVVISAALEVTWITALAGADVTCSPALSATPATSAAVKNVGVHYSLSTTELKSFWTSFWRGDIVREDSPGCKVSKLEMNFSTGELIVPKFSFSAKKTNVGVTEAYGLGAPSYDTADVLVASNMKVRVGGATYDCSNVAFAIDNTQAKRQAVTTSGITKILRTERKITGSFSLLYESKGIEDAMRAATKSELVLFAGSVAGNLFAVRFPQIRYTDVPKSVADGLYQYDVSFQAGMNACVGESEMTSLVFF